MPVPFKICVNKQILHLSKGCASHDEIETIGHNCAIALVLKDIFPDVFVTGHAIFPFGVEENNQSDELKIELPKIAQDFIIVFDALCEMPDCRLLLPELEFEILIPDAIISQINIDEIGTTCFQEKQVQLF